MSILLCFSTHSYGSEKTLSSFVSNQAYKPYEALTTLSGLILYQLNYIFHIVWYTIFKPTEENLYQAINNKNSIATHIILTYPHINPNYVTPNHCGNNSLLHIACWHRDLQTVNKLLSFDQIKPNIFDGNNHTPLHEVCYICRRKATKQNKGLDLHEKIPNLLEIIKIFIKHPKTDVNKTINYSTVLSWACEMGYADIVKLLLARQDINIHQKLNRNNTETCLRIAHRYNRMEIFDILCEHPQTNPLEIFGMAIEYGYLKCVKKLLNNKSLDPFISKKNEETPLYIAYTNRHYGRQANLEIIKALILYPATDINAIIKKKTVLSWACKEGHTDIVKLLLNCEKNIEINNKYYYHSGSHDGITCLRMACEKHYQEIFDLLSNHPTIDPIELFAVAVENGYEEIVKKLLKQYQCDILKSLKEDSLSKAAKTGNIEIFELLLKYQSIPINHDAYNTALYKAVKYGNEALVQLLLTIPNIHIHKKNTSKKTPFYLAIETNNIPIALLLYNHTNNIVNEYFLDGNTPLICAAEQNNKEMINFLIDICKANLSSEDDQKATFFHYLALADQPLDLEQLTFFKNYSNTQKKQFINAQLESFIHIAFTDYAKENIQRTVYPFINYCKKYSGDLNQRSNKHDRPVDTAYKILTLLAQHIDHDSAQFIIKEKIYHAFLNQTDAIPEHQLHFMLKNKLNFDAKNNIMRYYYAVTIDQKIISFIIGGRNEYQSYYEKNKEQKRILKENALNETYKSLGY